MTGMATEQRLLDELAAARNRSVANEPEQRAAIQCLARWYCAHRQPGRARPYVHELWMLSQKQLGATHELTVQHLSWLASILVSLGKVERAEQLLIGLAAQCHDVPAAAVGEVASALNQLVELHHRRGRMDVALTTCQRVIALLAHVEQRGPAATRDVLATVSTPTRSVSEVSPETSAASRIAAELSQLVRARNNLAALHVARGEFDLARRAFLRNLRLARKRLSPGDPALGVQLMNLAAVLRLGGRLKQSERLTIRAVRQTRPHVGWYHPLVAQGLSNLGAYRLQAGRFESAESLLRKATTIRRRLHPVGHVLIAKTQRQLA